MRFPATPWERAGRGALGLYSVLVLGFLMLPMLVMVPLSFNAEWSFTFTEGMLHLRPEAFSLRWYRGIVEDRGWFHALINSLAIGVPATILSTTLGTLAAVGLASRHMPARGAVMSLLISPMVVPIIITGAGMLFFYGEIGLARSHLGLILAHTTLCTPFVVVTVMAALARFDPVLTRAAASLGAGPVGTFFHVQLPLIRAGVFSGALFAFVISLDEVIVVTFMGSLDQRTIPRQMWSGIREHLDPEILAVGTLMIAVAVAIPLLDAWLRRERKPRRRREREGAPSEGRG